MRERIVAAALGWVGTPYVHQAACRGAGCDCLGLVRGVWTEVVGAAPARVPAYSADWSEPAGEERLWRAARDLLVPVDEARPGSVLLFRMRARAVAKHLGIMVAGGADPRFVHAYSGHGVTVSRLTPPWARKVVARFDFPGIEED